MQPDSSTCIYWAEHHIIMVVIPLYCDHKYYFTWENSDTNMFPKTNKINLNFDNFYFIMYHEETHKNVQLFSASTSTVQWINHAGNDSDNSGNKWRAHIVVKNTFHLTKYISKFDSWTIKSYFRQYILLTAQVRCRWTTKSKFLNSNIMLERLDIEKRTILFRVTQINTFYFQ